MKGTIFVKRLNPSGFHVSEADTDKCFVSDENPTGYFKMTIEPFDIFGNPFIKYEKTEGGYWIEGEGYIHAGCEEEVNEDIKEQKRRYEHRGEVVFMEAKL